MKITEQIKYKIKEFYESGLSTVKISKEIHTSPKIIKEVLFSVGIDIHDDNRTTGPRMKHTSGYWLKKENCENAAKQCRNRREFYHKFSTAAKKSRQNNWIDEFAEKYFSKEINYNSFEKEVHCVYSYEFKETNSVYVGRTTNIKRRDCSHRSDIKDTVFKHSKNEDVEIPQPKILIENINGEKSLELEEYWVIQYKKIGWNILNKSKTGIHSGSLGSSIRKWSYETCKTAASLCKNKEEFKKKYSRAHNVSRENAWIDEFFPYNDKKINGYFDKIENCKKESKKFSSIMEIRKKYPFLYQKISKNKWTEEIRIYINENKEKRKIAKKTVLCFNEKNSIKLSELNLTEKCFYNTLNDIFEDKIIIDNRTEPNRRLIIRIECKKIILVLLTVKNCGTFTSNINNSYHKNLHEYCVYRGYNIIQVYDYEYKNDKNLIINKIKQLCYMNNTLQKINARECVIKTITKSECEDFLNKNHIQKFTKSTIYLGGYYNEKLCAVMSFKLNPMNSNEEWELNRFACDINLLCRGIAGKMLNFFIKEKKPNSIVSFADKRFSNGTNNVYEKIGFIKKTDTALSYKYFSLSEKNNKTLYHKLLFNKQKLHKKYGFPLTMTETEMAKELGYDRIWDCGLIKYVWENKESTD